MPKRCSDLPSSEMIKMKPKSQANTDETDELPKQRKSLRSKRTKVNYNEQQDSADDKDELVEKSKYFSSNIKNTKNACSSKYFSPLTDQKSSASCETSASNRRKRNSDDEWTENGKTSVKKSKKLASDGNLEKKPKAKKAAQSVKGPSQASNAGKSKKNGSELNKNESVKKSSVRKSNNKKLSKSDEHQQLSIPDLNNNNNNMNLIHTRPSGEIVDLLMEMEYAAGQDAESYANSNNNVDKMMQSEEDEGSKSENDNDDEDPEAEDEEDDEFEDVEETELDGQTHEDKIRNHRASVAKEGLSITVAAMPKKNKKEKNKQKECLDWVRCDVNRNFNQNSANIHCIHTLCLIARMFYLRRLIDDQEMRGLALSLGLDKLVDHSFHSESGKLKKGSIISFVSAYRQLYSYKPTQGDKELFTPENIHQFLAERHQTNSPQLYTFGCLLAISEWLRNCGHSDCLRLIYAIDSVPIRCDQHLVFRSKDKNDLTLIMEKIDLKRVFQRKGKSKLFDLQLWFELYAGYWIAIDPLNNICDEFDKFEQCFPQLPPYVLSLDNQSVLKDVTFRYARDAFFDQKYQKLRMNGWLRQTLDLYSSAAKTKRDLQDEQEKDQLAAKQPFPKTISGFKDHPLFVLKRHLLKQEVIYPPTAQPLGFFGSNKEPIYARDTVKTGHSKSFWTREARTVRPDEEPCKIVCARPKYDKITKDYIRGLPLELYGIWQTDPYKPPVAKDGKVPRNEYFNVDLFKPEMVPIGCVHLRLNGLQKIAGKLKIDCAPAIVGFDVVGGHGTAPMQDGWVVCEEFKDVLVDAWHEEERKKYEREEQKYRERVYRNWKTLIGLARAQIRVRERYKNA